MKKLLVKLRSAVYMSQEFTLWLPGLVLLSVIGYVLIGGIVRVGPDALAWLVELPVLCTYAAAWIGAAWVLKFVYMHDLPRATEIELQRLALDGDPGAQWVLLKDRLETFGALLITLVFFWPMR